MDVYVASKAENYLVIRLFMRALEEAGHDITYDWTTAVEVNGPAGGNINYRREMAALDLNGVKECDIFVLVMYKGMVGSLIEFGAALAWDKHIYIVGDAENMPVQSIFFDSTEITWHYPSLHAIPNLVKFCDRLQEREDRVTMSPAKAQRLIDDRNPGGVPGISPDLTARADTPQGRQESRELGFGPLDQQ
jgi:hypothetical protein